MERYAQRFSVLQSWLVLGGLVALLAPVATYAIVFWGSWALDVQSWASYATYLSGTVAVLFSGLGIVALVQNLRLQQTQIDKLEEDSRKRQFESHLDQLLQVVASAIRETDIRKRGTNEQIALGRDAYRHFYRRLKRIYTRRLKTWTAANFDERVLVRESFDELYRKAGSDFGYYFRTLYQCVVLIEQAQLSDQDCRRYLDIVTCRLSKFELLLLMYNCLGTVGERKFKRLVEEFSLLEHVEKRSVINVSHIELFSPKAFA